MKVNNSNGPTYLEISSYRPKQKVDVSCNVIEYLDESVISISCYWDAVNGKLITLLLEQISRYFSNNGQFRRHADEVHDDTQIYFD